VFYDICKSNNASVTIATDLLLVVYGLPKRLNGLIYGTDATVNYVCVRMGLSFIHKISVLLTIVTISRAFSHTEHLSCQWGMMSL